MHEAHNEPHSGLVIANDAEEMLRILEKRLLEPYFDPPVESLLDFLADVGKEHFDQKLAELTDPLRRADVEDERENLESNLREYRERLAKAEEESGEEASEAWRRAHEVEFERVKLRHADLLRSRIGNLLPLA